MEPQAEYKTATAESAEERMLRKLGYETLEKVRAILGEGCDLELNITGAKLSKIAFMQECNGRIISDHAFGNYKAVYLSDDKSYIVRAKDNSLPF